ncbi:nicotinamide-nucleotide amidohydrolase family protein [Microbacterium sp. LRZ72]|uniref:CinA family protein n=1 Tax=Microbacterium sp. LRZ72 TaxID=2942481 RepID=UPI0029B568D5|nr:nicotinamide-nucleotide amidohydrolase family protein [Microbacterium sp. LRZ72]MDX2377448.1 nicotinamide-nucleotide amidohydrolase family protein [Microbacterium sp. LRZ72]
MSHEDARLLLEALARRRWTVATAESLTGGLLAAALTSVPGASAHVRGGVVTYATAVKTSLLGVDAALLQAHGAVDPRVAQQMADGARTALAVDGVPADVGISTTGVAGPGRADGRDAGTVYVGVATPRGVAVHGLALSGERDRIRADTVAAALRATIAAVDGGGE